MFAVLLFFAVAFPFTLQAAMVSPAFTSFGVDRTTIQPGQEITFNMRTTAAATFVFADVNGVRVQAARQGFDFAGNQNWQLSVTPNTSQTINIFASTTNTTAGAATMFVPVTVTEINQGQGPSGGAGLAIHSIRELASLTQGTARLEVVTGPDVGAVWVHLASLGNAGFFNSQQPVSVTATSRTFIIEIRPGIAWHPQTVTVSANRVFGLGGETTQQFNLTLSQIMGTPQILNTIPAQTAQAINGIATFTVNTNAAVNHVWAVVGGQRFEGRRTGNTNQWVVDIWVNIGTNNLTAQIWASSTGVQTDAVSVMRNITRTGTGSNTWQFIDNPTFMFVSGNTARIEAVTGTSTNRVSLQIGGTTHHLTNIGTIGNTRTWAINVVVPSNITNIPVRAFTSSTASWNSTHDERWIHTQNLGGISGGQILFAQILNPPNSIDLNYQLPTLNVQIDTTGTGVLNIEIYDPLFPHINLVRWTQTSGNRWIGIITLNPSTLGLGLGVGGWGHFSLEARAVGTNNTNLGTAQLGTFSLTR